MTKAQNAIMIVDDDPSVRDALSVILSMEGFAVTAFETGDMFLNALAKTSSPACVLLDVHMPGQSGLEVLRSLQKRGFRAPVFVISGQGDIPMAVEAIKLGAHDFLEKPFDANTVISRINDVIKNAGQLNDGFPPETGMMLSVDCLTSRERDVLEHIVAGASNKEAGRILGISPRTVEVHRAKIMEKLGAKNAADLVRIAISGKSNAV